MKLLITDLAVSRGALPVLSGVGFALKAGRALILRGPNGIGKTTLLRTLAGLQPAHQGQISLAPDQMAYASHADGVKPTLTVTENLRFWAAIYGAPDIAPALETFALTDLAHRAALTLSSGQRRRLSLARLCLTGRPVWLLDEPTISLDTISTQAFANAITAHLASGGLALIATHINLGLTAPEILDLTPFRAAPNATHNSFDAAFA